MSQDPTLQTARARKRWDSPSNTLYGAPGDMQRRMQRSVPNYGAQGQPGSHARYHGYVSVKPDIPTPRRSSTPHGTSAYMQAQDMADMSPTDALDPTATDIENPVSAYTRSSALDTQQYFGNLRDSSQRYHAQYRSTSGGSYHGASTPNPSRYQRVMFESNLPSSARTHTAYDPNYTDYDKSAIDEAKAYQSSLYGNTLSDQITDPVQRSIINEAEELVEQYEVEQGEATPEGQTYAVTPIESQSSMSSGGEPADPATLTTLERDLAKREKEERRQLHKDLKRFQKQRRKLLLSQQQQQQQQQESNEYVQDAENYDPATFSN